MRRLSKSRKGISEIFGSLLVLIVTIAMGVPLLLYFNSLYNTNSNVIGKSFQNLNNALSTHLTVIQLRDLNLANETYLYNYGNTPVHITQLIVNKTVYNVNFTINPNHLVPLTAIYPQIPNNLENSTVIIQANGNYYTIIG